MNIQSHPKAVRVLLLLIALTAGLSLLYGVQYYLGGPVRLAVSTQVYDLAVSPNGSWVAAANRDGTVRLWNLDSDWAMRTFPQADQSVIEVDFSSDSGTVVSVNKNGTIRLRELPDGQLLAKLGDGNQTLNNAAVSADKSTLATVGEQGLVQVWSLTDREMIRSIGPNENTKHAVALSADGALVAAGDGQDIQIWDVASGEAVQRLQGGWEDEAAQQDWLGHQHQISALAFSPDGTYLASGDVAGNMWIWDLEDGEAAWETRGHLGSVADLSFEPDGNFLVSGGSDNMVRIWQIPGGRFANILQGHLGGVDGVVFGPAQDTVISASSDGSVRYWETVNSEMLNLVWTRTGLTSIWGSVFGNWMLVSGVLGLILLWGLWQMKAWSHFGALVLYLVGPLFTVVLPLLETTAYPIDWAGRIGIAWPLLLLTGWYFFLVYYMRREEVARPYEAPGIESLAQKLMAAQRVWGWRKSLLIGATWLFIFILVFSVLRRFNLDLAFMNKWLPFIMKGSRDTMIVSIAAISLATFLALLGALGRLSDNPVANGVSGFYISMIRGTPLLVQIYIWYLALPQMGLVLEPIQAGIMACGVNYGAYMTEIFRAGIQAIGKGQHEAAHALGMSTTQTLRRIVLPQAFRIVIPPIGNQFIAMMKDSSLVSIMGVWELTFRAEKIGKQNFRSLETFLIAAAFYWVLTIIFQFFQGKLEEYMARGERR